MPQGCPATIRCRPYRAASSSAPSHQRRDQPAAARGAAATGAATKLAVAVRTDCMAAACGEAGVRCAARPASQATRPQARTVIASASGQPKASRSTAGRPPSAIQAGWCEAPTKLPRAKVGSTAKDSGAPAPALYSVPEPQPSASCIAAPNRKAPSTRLIVSGATAPTSSPPLPAISGRLTAAASTISSICAHRPCGSRRSMKSRQPVVKPKRTPCSTAPKPMPSSASRPWRTPAASITASTPARPPTTRNKRVNQRIGTVPTRGLLEGALDVLHQRGDARGLVLHR